MKLGMRMKTAIAAFLALCAGCKHNKQPPPASGFTAADLGAGRCTAINSAGQAAGIDDSGQAFIVSATARTALPALPDGSPPVALSINDSGHVAGYVQSAATRQAVVLANGAWQTVPFLSGGGWS